MEHRNSQVLAAAVMSLLAGPAFAADGTWNVASGTNLLWSTPSNWTSLTVPGVVPGGTDSIANFDAKDLTGNVSVKLGADRNVGQLNFADTAATYHSTTLKTDASYRLILDTTSGNATVTVGNGGATITTVIASADTEGLTKMGSGTLRLTGANIYNGTTSVNQGTLQVDGSMSASSPTIVAGGATLSGTGVLQNVTVQAGGTIAPGTTGTGVTGLSVSSLTLENGAVYQVDVASATDPIITELSADYLDLNSYDVTSGKAIVKAAGTQIGGGVADFDGFSGVYAWVIARSATNAFNLNDFVLDATGLSDPIGPNGAWSLGTGDNGHNLMLRYSYDAVPEAGTMLLGMCGVMPLLSYRRRSRKA